MNIEQEKDLVLIVTYFPSGVRDFQIFRRVAQDVIVALDTFELLASDRAAHQIEQLARGGDTWRQMAPMLALSRLMVQEIIWKRTGRHIAAEELSQYDLRGETFGSKTLLARDLSREQAAEWKLIVEEGHTPTESLRDVAWKSFTSLPVVADTFVDENLQVFANALHNFLVPAGKGQVDVNGVDIHTRVRECFNSGFANLNLPFQKRDAMKLFSKLLAVSLRLASQLSGEVAKHIVRQILFRTTRREAEATLTPREEELIELRYGAPRALGGVSTAFLFNCRGPVADAINEFALGLALAESESELLQNEERLKGILSVLGKFRIRRQELRAEERGRARDRCSDKIGGRKRQQAQGQPDAKSVSPGARLAMQEEMSCLKELLPISKPRDVRRVNALIECGGDPVAAAKSLGIPVEVFLRQMRQTVRPNLRKAQRRLQRAKGSASEGSG